MNRSDFLKSLTTDIAAFATGGLKALTPEEPRWLLLGEMPVAGYKYYIGKKIEHLMEPGKELSLKREPENEYDEAAIAVYFNKIKIGYLPHAENATIALLMDQQANVAATISDFDPNAGPWERVWVEVRMRGNYLI